MSPDDRKHQQLISAYFFSSLNRTGNRTINDLSCISALYCIGRSMSITTSFKSLNAGMNSQSICLVGRGPLGQRIAKNVFSWHPSGEHLAYGLFEGYTVYRYIATKKSSQAKNLIARY